MALQIKSYSISWTAGRESAKPWFQPKPPRKQFSPTAITRPTDQSHAPGQEALLLLPGLGLTGKLLQMHIWGAHPQFQSVGLGWAGAPLQQDPRKVLGSHWDPHEAQPPPEPVCLSPGKAQL